MDIQLQEAQLKPSRKKTEIHLETHKQTIKRQKENLESRKAKMTCCAQVILNKIISVFLIRSMTSQRY